jgi:hypothetical protein
MKLLKVISTLCIISISQLGYSASINPVNTKDIIPVGKSSLINKSIKDGKIKGNAAYDQDLKVIRSLNSASKQNFFASQNQQFSKFIQSIFAQIGS